MEKNDYIYMQFLKLICHEISDFIFVCDPVFPSYLMY